MISFYTHMPDFFHYTGLFILVNSDKFRVMKYIILFTLLKYIFQVSVLYLSLTFSNNFFFCQHTQTAQIWTFYPLHLKTYSLHWCLNVSKIQIVSEIIHILLKVELFELDILDYIFLYFSSYSRTLLVFTLVEEVKQYFDFCQVMFFTQVSALLLQYRMYCTFSNSGANANYFCRSPSIVLQLLFLVSRHNQKWKRET